MSSDPLPGPSDEDTEARLARRIARRHLRQRLGIEAERHARVFGQGANFFHIENWYSVHGLIRVVLRLAGVHARGRRNAVDVRVRENRIVLPRLPAAFDGFTLLHLTDLHLDMRDDMPAAIARRVEGLQHDAVVLTGDFRASTVGPWRPAVDGLRALRGALGERVYAVLGNHDSIRMVPAMEDLGIEVLLNEAVAIERGDARLWLAGIDDPHYYRSHNLERAGESIPDDDVAVLLAHSPEVYREAAHAGFDVMLCGHTHAGQICLPGGVPLMTNARCPRRYCAGAWRHADLVGYTSAGTGVSIVDVRLNCPAEATLHRLCCT